MEEIHPGRILQVENQDEEHEDEITEFEQNDSCLVCKNQDEEHEDEITEFEQNDRTKREPEDNGEKVIDWVGCKTCPRWYHDVCLKKMDANATSCIVCTYFKFEFYIIFR